MPTMPDTPPPQSLAGLDFFPRQWQAVTAPIGPILVLAGPGADRQLPRGREDDAGIHRVDDDVNRAGVLIDEQHAFPR